MFILKLNIYGRQQEIFSRTKPGAHSINDRKSKTGCGKKFILLFAMGLVGVYHSSFEFYTDEVY